MYLSRMRGIALLAIAVVACADDIPASQPSEGAHRVYDVGGDYYSTDYAVDSGLHDVSGTNCLEVTPDSITLSPDWRSVGFRVINCGDQPRTVDSVTADFPEYTFLWGTDNYRPPLVLDAGMPAYFGVAYEVSPCGSPCDLEPVVVVSEGEEFRVEVWFSAL